MNCLTLAFFFFVLCHLSAAFESKRIKILVPPKQNASASDTDQVEEQPSMRRPVRAVTTAQQIETCSEQASASTGSMEALPRGVKVYYKMCIRPAAFWDCMKTVTPMGPFPIRAKMITLMFCNEYLPETKDVTPEMATCLEDQFKHGQKCNLFVSSQEQLTALILSEQPCKDAFESRKCLIDETKKHCPANVDAFLDFQFAFLGGPCLAENEILNPLVTMEVCDSAPANQSGVLALLVPLTVALFISRA